MRCRQNYIYAYMNSLSLCISHPLHIENLSIRGRMCQNDTAVNIICFTAFPCWSPPVTQPFVIIISISRYNKKASTFVAVVPYHAMLECHIAWHDYILFPPQTSAVLVSCYITFSPPQVSKVEFDGHESLCRGLFACHTKSNVNFPTFLGKS